MTGEHNQGTVRALRAPAHRTGARAACSAAAKKDLVSDGGGRNK